MSWRNIKLIFTREVRDQLRDRRTLFMIAVLPLLLYPAMGLGMLHMMSLFSEQQRTVVVLGAAHLPQQPALLNDGRFVSTWFEIGKDADTLKVVTDLESAVDPAVSPSNADLASGSQGTDERPGSEPVSQSDLLTQARQIADRVQLVTELNSRITTLLQLPELETPQRGELELLQTQLADAKLELSRLYSKSQMEVLIVVPQGFAAEMERFNQEIRLGVAADRDYPRPVIVRNSADDKSIVAYRRVQEAMGDWERALLDQRLTQANLPVSLPRPVNPEQVDVANDDEKAANLWSKLFPALLIIMAVTGAFYPAVDIGAGEKERGTMETLLICPATRTEIVLGKFLTVMLFSVATVILNIASMGLTGSHMHSMAGGELQQMGDLSMPPVSSIVWLLVLLIPLSAFFSALCLSLAMFARSSKEGQYYLSPLLMITLGLTVFCMSPAIEISPTNDASWFYCVIPVVGPALLLKGFLLSPDYPAPLYIYAIPVLITSVGYSLLALWWAIDQFKREDILFREAERFELRLWVRHLMRDKEPLPSFAEAGVCFVMIMLLQFAAMRFMRPDGGLGDGLGMMKLLIVQQLALIAMPAVMMGLILTTRPLETLRIRRPSWSMLGVACVLPLALHPLSLELQARLSWFFPRLPEEITSVLQTMGDENQPLWFVLMAFALAPAVCEEVAYRGFILSGFGRSGRRGLAIGLSSLAFGIMHMIPQQVFNASLLGLVLGLLAIRSRSLFPCILFHLVFNATAVLHGRFGAEVPTTGVWDWFFLVGPGGLRYRPLTIAIAAGISTALISWLLSREARQQPSAGLDAVLPMPDVSR